MIDPSRVFPQTANPADVPSAQEEATASVTPVDPTQTLHAGMEVYGANDSLIGTVKEVGPTDFTVDRTLQRDVYVPFTAIRAIGSNRVELNVVAGHVDSMGWATPVVTGDEEE